MKQAIIKKLFAFLSVAFCFAAISNNVLAQGGEETVAASESQLLSVMLPANAQRVLPQSVPTEVNQTLDKIVEAGEGKIRKGDTEVLIWSGAGYKKTAASNTINRLTGSLASAGWKYSVEGEENGVTIFSAFKEGASRRAVVGFYGATDEVLMFAAVELLPNGTSAATANNTGNDSQVKRVETSVPVKNAGNGANLSQLVGKWHNGTVSMMQEKNLTTGQTTSSNGSTFTYKFFPDGRFEYIGYMKSTMYGCTTDLFNDKRGSVQISGDQITFIPTKNFWRNTYSCSPASNKERDYVLDRETYTLRTKTDEYGKSLICLANAKGETCFRREE